MQRLSVAISLLIHLSYVGYLEYYPLVRLVKAAPPIEHKFMRLVAPPREEVAAPVPKPSGMVAPTAVPTKIAVEEKPKQFLLPTPDDSKADATNVAITYRDPKMDLPAILRFYQGYVAFGRQAERYQYVRHVFAAADLREIPGGIVSLDSFCSIMISGSGYVLVDDLRSKHHLEDYLAYALFNEEFDNQLRITLKRAAIARYGGGKIASATVVFSAAAENGLEIGELAMVDASH